MYSSNATTVQSPSQPQIPGSLFMNIVLTSMILSIVASTIGIVTNTINIMVFTRSRSKDSINVSLLGLAVTDFFVCLTGLFVTIFSTSPSMNEFLFKHLNFYPVEVVFFSFGLAQTLFARNTIYMTALIAFERCLCVVMPLKVKTIITPNRVRFLVAFGYFLTGLIAIPIYYINRLVYVFVPMFNRSVIRHMFTKDFRSVSSWHTPIDCFIYYIFLFPVIIVSTALLIISLNRKVAWRETATSSSTTPSNDVSTKEKKIAKMVIMISSIFTVCYLPNFVVFMLISFVPNFTFSTAGIVGDVIRVYGVFNYFLTSFNSSINVIIYYRNSSNYREIFDTIFHIKRKEIKK